MLRLMIMVKFFFKRLIFPLLFPTVILVHGAESLHCVLDDFAYLGMYVLMMIGLTVLTVSRHIKIHKRVHGKRDRLEWFEFVMGIFNVLIGIWAFCITAPTKETALVFWSDFFLVLVISIAFEFFTSIILTLLNGEE